jgi:hypothetical protein
MTKDEILSMAKSAGFPEWWFNPPEIERKNGEALNLLLRFAALVAEKATEQANARQNASWALMCEKMLAAEREECAKLVDLESKLISKELQSAKAIRARGQNEYRGARLVLTKDGVIQDGWMGDK